MTILFNGCATVFDSNNNSKMKDVAKIILMKKYICVRPQVEIGPASGGTWYPARNESNRKELLNAINVILVKYFELTSDTKCERGFTKIRYYLDLSVVDKNEDRALLSLISLYLIPYRKKIKLSLTITTEKEGKVIYTKDFNEIKNVYFHLLLIPIAPFYSPAKQFKNSFSELVEQATDNMIMSINNEL
jgi:hypothetical protein